MFRTVNRRGARFVLGLVATALALVVPAAPGAASPAPGVRSASGSDAEALADRYVPVVRLVRQDTDCGPGEPFLPTDVDTLLGNPTVALRGPWDTDDMVKIGPSGADLGAGLTGYHVDLPGSPLKPGCSYEEWAHEQTLGSAPTTYARVVSESGRDGLALQYWLYYPSPPQRAQPSRHMLVSRAKHHRLPATGRRAPHRLRLEEGHGHG